MAESRVFVAGANGQLGSVIVRKLAAAGVPVRAVGRNAEKLEALRAPDVEIVPVDLLNLAALTKACRIVYLSAYGIDQDSPVDIFRLKWYIEDAIRRSGVPYVILRPTAFMDIWVDQIIADPIRKKGAATIFGPGTARANYIAVDDVAEFVVKILVREEVINEVVEIGGPSTMSMNDLTTLVEQQLGRGGRRHHIPVFAMRLLPPIVRMVDERAARLMTLGYFATIERPFPEWKQAADRFGVRPRTLEEHIRRVRGA